MFDISDGFEIDSRDLDINWIFTEWNEERTQGDTKFF